jgi:hypothetical protein
MSVRRLVSTGLATVGVLGGWLALSPAPVPAQVIRPLISPFGAFAHPTGVAVDQASGNVYVANGGGPEIVDVFNAAGEATPVGGLPHELTGGETPAASFNFNAEPAGVAVDNSCFYEKLSGAACTAFDASNGDVYVSDVQHNVLDKFKANGSKFEYACEINGWYGIGGQACLASGGSPTQAFNEQLGVTVDPKGNVYVANYSPGVVYEYNAAGEGVREFTSPKIGKPQWVALDASGNLYIQSYSGGQVVEIKRDGSGAPTGEELELATGATAIAFDRTTSHLLVAYRTAGKIAEYDAAGKETGPSFAPPNAGSAEGLAINDTTDEIYLSDRAHKNGDIFGPAQLVPSVVLAPFTNLQGESITLNGVVNPEKIALTRCEFRYGVSVSYGSSAPCVPPPGSGESPVDVSASLSGLQPGTVYHYSLLVGSGSGNISTGDEPFETGASVSDRAAFASNVTQLGATLNATINPGEIPTTYHFVYGTTPAYGAVAPVPDASVHTGIGDVGATQILTGLRPGITYHFAVVANSAAGQVIGTDETFTTPLVPAAIVSTGALASLTLGAATLTGAIDPQGWDVGYYFEYGTSTAYGSRWPSLNVSLGHPTGSQSVVTYVQNLLPGTTYHYRLAASNAGGISYGADQTFTTPEYPPSAVQEAPLLNEKIGIKLEVPSAGSSKPKARKGKRHGKSKPRKKGKTRRR